MINGMGVLDFEYMLTLVTCSNVVAATDFTLLALAGIGLHYGKVWFP